MRYPIWFVLFFIGCSEASTELTAWQKAMRDGSVEAVQVSRAVEAKSDEILVAISEVKTQVETLEASLVDSESVRKEDDQQSAVEPQEVAKANQSQPSKPVASPPAVRSSGPIKLSWNVEGNWQPSILETAKHLREDHGIIADGMTHQQMHDAHAAAHEGRQVANKSQPVQMVNRGSQCPNGQCPQPRRGLFGRRR
jgi:hypothetical protein